MSGTLFVVATPIGNLEDLSRRALQTLSDVQIIACEDTRRTGSLLSAIGIVRRSDQRLAACHDHNEARVTQPLLEALQHGADVALVSDAGTPLLNDPGFALVRAAWNAGITVTPIPGPSAALALLSVCPLPVDHFRFEGFLPPRATARQSLLRALQDAAQTLIFFEAPHRVLASLADIDTVLGPRRLFVGREMTKRYEQFYLGTAAEIAERLQAEDAERGEFAIAIEAPPKRAPGAADAGTPLDEQTLQMLGLLTRELGPAKAAKLTAALRDKPRAVLYARAVDLPR